MYVSNTTIHVMSAQSFSQSSQPRKQVETYKSVQVQWKRVATRYSLSRFEHQTESNIT